MFLRVGRQSKVTLDTVCAKLPQQSTPGLQWVEVFYFRVEGIYHKSCSTVAMYCTRRVHFRVQSGGALDMSIGEL